MEKVVYLLGAGASYGVRDSKPESFKVQGILSAFKESYECPKIIEGLPIVSELSDRMLYVVSRLEEEMTNINYNSEGRDLYQKVIEGIKWAQKESLRHATIDTFAKKLWVTDRTKENYNKLKQAISVFFTLEQHRNKVDKRYDSFFASIIKDAPVLLPENISILSWNYDCQLELAFAEYLQSNDLNHIQGVLKMFHKNIVYDQVPTKGFNVIKLNGTALLYNKAKNAFIDLFNTDKEDSILERIAVSAEDSINIKNTLSFAWEQMSDTFQQRIIDSISDATILVIIGYSFPYFNREIDKLIFNNLSKLKKVYIQDKSPDAIEESVRNLFTDYHRRVNNTVIEKKTNLNQFFLPPEL